MARLAFPPFLSAFDNNGDPLPGALAYWYLAGTTNAADSFTSSTLGVPNANPVIADSAGRFGDMWLSDTLAYKLVLKTAAGVTVRTTDNVYGTTETSAGAGLLYGLTLSNNVADATNDIDIAAGVAIDSTNARFMTLAASITKRTDAPWAVGSGNGGWLDGASMPNGTGHAFLVTRLDTGVVDVGFSASLTPTLPTNYTLYRRIGSILRESAAILPFKQAGDLFQRASPAADISAANPGTSAVTRTLSVPAGLNVEAILHVGVTNGTPVNAYGILSDLDTNDYAPDPTNGNIGATIAGTVMSQVRVRTSTSRTIRSRLNASDVSLTLRINTSGWVDTRGRVA